MSDVVENEGTMDFSKMKVNDLKKLLKSRGLSVAGVKQDLIERLQSSEAAAEALLEGSEVGEDGFDEELDKELDESALMADEEHTDDITASSTEVKEKKENNEESKPNEESAPPSTSPKKSEECKEPSKMDVEHNGSSEVESQSKQMKLSLKSQPLAMSEADKKKARAERFGTLQKNQASNMAKRAERFSLNKNSTSKAADSSTSQTKVTSTTTNEVLKRRAERFGILSPAEVKRQHLEKLQARKLRFQQSTVASAVKEKVATTTASSIAPTTTTTTTNGTKISTSLTLEDRKRMRAERFKITT